MSRNDQDNTAAVSSLVMPEAWTEKGACVRALNPDAWFPERGANGNMEARLALRVCADCPVKDLCLKEALAQGPSCEGIWGGTTHAERRKMLRMAAQPSRSTRPSLSRRPKNLSKLPPSPSRTRPPSNPPHP